METLLGQIVGSMPVGAVILVFAYVILQRLNDLSHRIDETNKLLIDHVIHHTQGGSHGS